MGLLLAMAVTLLSRDITPAQPPTLHRRAIYASEDDRVVATWKPGAFVFLGANAEFFRFRDRAEGVAIVSHAGEVSGYLLKHAGGKSDKGLVLGYDFSDVAESRDQFCFRTRQVHGVWYAFEGQIAPKRTLQAGNLGLSDVGASILRGTLTMHDEAQQTVQQQTVSLSFAGRP